MDYIFGSLLVTLLILLLIYFRRSKEEKEYWQSDYVKITKKPYKQVKKDKGLYGEYELFKYLKNINSDFKIVPNVYIPNDFGVTEIDMVLIHNSGIYIFENKNFQGTIKGSEKDRKWIQELGGQRNEFFSPVVQNRGHVIAIMKYLKKRGFTRFIPHYSVIVFPEDSTLDVGVIYDKYTNVTKMKGLRVILNYLMSGNKILSHNDVEELYELFIERSQVSGKVKKQHMKTVQKAIKRNQ